MATYFGLVLSVFTLATGGCVNVMATLDRDVTKSFTVKSGSVVVVEVSGGSVTANPGPAGLVRAVLREQVPALTENDANDVLAHYDIVTAQAGDTVTIRARRKAGEWLNGRQNIRFSVTLTVPADVRLDLHTSGGQIVAAGDRTASLRAQTSGGSVNAGGGAGDIDLDTSGGRIVVERALGALRAKTSGGSIDVDYIGRTSPGVDLSTSGGSIRAGVDPAGAFDIAADTSGGSARVEGFPNVLYTGNSERNAHYRGQVNGGGSHLSARTSGGSILIHRADAR